jgi:uncharacterized repeat protein (TIGR02059 family)
MPAFELSVPKLNNDPAKSIKDLYNAYVETTQQLQWLLTHLDDKNVLKAKEALIAKLYAGEITTDQIVAGTAKISLALIEDIVAQNIVTNTFITNTLYASKADIAELTVDRLETSDKAYRYIHSDTSDMNFIRIQDNYYDFITASVKTNPYQQWANGLPQSPVLSADFPYQFIQTFGAATYLYVLDEKIWHHSVGTTYYLDSDGAYKKYSYNGSTWTLVTQESAGNFGLASAGGDFVIPQNNCIIYSNDTFTSTFKTATISGVPLTEQLEDRNGTVLYWTDGTQTVATYTDTGYPVTVYQYTELIKMRLSFAADETGNYIPKIIMGLGAGVEGHPDWGKAFIYKDVTGLLLQYLKQADGSEVSLRIGENGIEGLAGFGIGTIYYDTNGVEKTINTVDSAVLTEEIIIPQTCKAMVNVSIEITVSGACNVSAKTYIDSYVLPYQPTLYCASANTFVLSYTDLARYVTSGTKTIEVQVGTDANGGTVAVEQATLIVQLFPDTMPTFSNPTGFTTTTISATEIDLEWSNPVSSLFTEIEVYKHTVDLSTRDRAYCDANATLIYNGTNESYNNTGLTAGTTYFYKVFAKYNINGIAYYSTGVNDSETTSVAPPILQSAATNTAGTVITLTFDKAMANPSGKHAQFSATAAGSARSITAAALNADTTKIDLTLASAVTSGQTVTISYTAGDVTSADTSPLASFSGQSVINNVVSPYQQWASGYPQSPALTLDYPYQVIITKSTNTYLFMSTRPMYKYTADNDFYLLANSSTKICKQPLWTFYGDWNDISSNFKFLDSPYTILQANNDVYNNSALTTIAFAKTTP